MPRHPERLAPSRWRSGSRTASRVVGVAGLMLALAGCSPPATPVSPSDTATPAPSSSAPTASASPTAAPEAEPRLIPDGTAEENLPLFAAVTAAVWNTSDAASGRAYIDGLVAAGFDKATMQVTHDTSTVGNPAESIQFSVRWGDECLIGQVGPATGEPVAVVAPVLVEGTCLVGETRPIDW